MSSVPLEENLAERWAHLLDDAVHIPGTRVRFGLDPVIGLIPVVGDVVVTACGAVTMMTARRLGVPARALLTMAWNLLVNGVIGSIPIVGDAFSFSFKCHAKNTAVLLREVKQGEDNACRLQPLRMRYADIALTTVLMIPILIATGLTGIWLWEHDISLVSLFFPAPYSSRSVQ